MTRRRLVAALVASAALVLGASLASGATNDISTVAGTGTAGFSGDGGPATAAEIRTPTAVAATADGGYLISDQGNSRVRFVSAAGVITTVAGDGTPGGGGDGGAATDAQLNAPNGLAATADGGFLIADSNNNRVRYVSPTGFISTLAGTGAAGGGGDNGPAASAQLSFPVGVAVLPDSSFLIADNDNHRIRQVSPNGAITTVAGTTAGFSGDDGPATSAQLNSPSAVAVTADGGYLIADAGNHRIRQVSPNGTITTVAGTTAGFSGDGGAATLAQINNPLGVTPLADGGFAIADTGNHRVRRVSLGGTITTMAGTGTAGFGGDGGPSTDALLNGPFGVALTTAGHVVIADTFNQRVRQVEGPAPAAPSIDDSDPDSPANDNSPELKGNAEAGSTVRLYATADCTGDPAATGGAAAFDDPGLTVGVADGSTNNFSATSTDAAGNVSGCSASFGYIENSQPTDEPLTLDELTAADPPTLGQDVNVGPIGDGPVLIAVPGGSATAGRAGASQKGLTFVPLEEARQIPVGSFLDTEDGSVELRSATGSGSRIQSGRFNQGLFQVLQSRRRRDRGLTEVRLKGSSFSRCRTGRRGRSAGAAQVSRRIIRRVRSNTGGNFRSRGKHSSATVRGTIWITADRCDGTLTTVKRGRVAVRDFRRKRTVIVRAGKSYLARAPG